MINKAIPPFLELRLQLTQDTSISLNKTNVLTQECFRRTFDTIMVTLVLHMDIYKHLIYIFIKNISITECFSKISKPQESRNP